MKSLIKYGNKYWKYWPWLFASILMVLIAAGYFWIPPQKQPSLILQADNDIITVLPQTKALDPALKLLDQDEKPFSLSNLKGQWSFLFFGYTFCPDVCPVSLGVLKRVYQSAPDNAKPQVVLVSVDPERDTPARLKKYLANFDSRFIGASADQAELKRFTKEMGVYAQKSDSVPPVSNSAHQRPDYIVDHTSSFFLLNPNAEVAAIFSPPHTDIEAIAKAYQQMVNQ